MGQILRFSTGKITIPVSVLIDIEDTLSMDSAEDRATVIAAVAASYNYPPDGTETTVHDTLYAREVDAIQRLRGWHRNRRGTIVVDAYDLSRVRNVLDTYASSTEECEAHLDELRHEADGAHMPEPVEDWWPAYIEQLNAEIAVVASFVDKRQSCGRCELCKVIALRDICDELLDNAGLYGGSYYEAYGKNTDDFSASEFWRTRVEPSAMEILAS